MKSFKDLTENELLKELLSFADHKRNCGYRATRNDPGAPLLECDCGFKALKRSVADRLAEQ